MRGVDIFKGNWEVNKEEIEVLETPVLELLPGDLSYLLTKVKPRIVRKQIKVSVRVL